MMFTLVIPTYNERENLPVLVSKISRICPDRYKIIIVDDNSPDGTGELADNLKKKYRNIEVLHRKKKSGLGSAILDGFRKCKTDIIGVIDSDLSHPPELIPKMMKYINEKDIVIASRYTKGGGTNEDWTPLRLLISKTAILLTFLLTDVKDPMSGFFFIRKSRINKTKLKPTSCKICLEILVKCRIDSFKEIPYIFTNRKKGSSEIVNTKEISRYIIHLIKLYYYKIKDLIG